jgi:hypothetical protein
MNKEIILMLLILVFTSLLFFLFRKEQNENLKGKFLKHSSLFLIGVSIVHFQFFIDFVLGNSNENDYYIWVNKRIVIKALVLSIIAVLSFIIGYLQYKDQSFKTKNANLNAKKTSVIFMEILAAIFLVIYFYFINPIYFLGNYGIVEISSVSSYTVVLFEYTIIAIIIQKSRNLIIENKRNITFFDFIKEFSWLTLSMIFIYLISVMLSGDRGPLIFFGIALLGNYIFVSRKKINLLKFLIFIIIGSNFITILGYVRALKTNDNFSEKFSTILGAETDLNRFGSKSFSPSTQELATSTRCLQHSMDIVPEKIDYLYGRFQFQQIMSIIPFFSNVNEIIFEDNHFKYRSSADFITWKNQGNFPYSGDGTTVIADFYLDFGLVGVIIGLFLIGYLMRYAEILMYSVDYPSLFAHCFFLIYLSSSLYISRGTFLIVLKSVCWTYFFLAINKFIFNNKIK